MLRRMGGTPETEAAVARALSWLARHQEADGRWDGQLYDRACGACDGASPYDVDIGLTGLSLLCFLGAGHTHVEDGPYRDHVRRALQWLKSQQDERGDLRQGETLYSHGIATIALAEALTMTGDATLQQPVRRAVEFLLAAQNRRTGGWRYEPGDEGDTSVLGWQIMALRSAMSAGVSVPPQALAGAERWLSRVEDRGQPGLVSYRPGQRPSPAMTAEALFVRQLLGARPEAPRVQNALALIARTPPVWSAGPDTYYWYYATLALFHHQGPGWTRWNDLLQPELLGRQERGGRVDGSWPAEGEWARVGGRVYQTAICTLMLEVYYRYLPMYAPRGDAEQPLGLLRGRVTDADTGQPLEGALVRLDLDGAADFEVRSDADGRYELAIERVPDFFVVSASQEDYLPRSEGVSADVLRERHMTLDFRLAPRSSDVIALEPEPEVHHLGNDRFEGRINSQFQKRSEGRAYRGELSIDPRHRLEGARYAELSLLVRGSQCPHIVRINGAQVDVRLDGAPADGSFGQIRARVPIAVLADGRNRLEIESTECHGDLDDFEFVNVQVRLRR